MMKTSNRGSQVKQSGFTLIEIMVGMVIGLLVTLVIVQVMSVFEGQKRATSGTADAQTNGAIALYNISRELQQAGFGMIPTGKDKKDSVLSCNQDLTDVNSAAAGLGFIPLTITDGVSDSITVRYGSSYLGGVPLKVESVAGREVTLNQTNLGCANSDFVIFTKNNKCALSKLEKGSDPAVATDGVFGTIKLNLKGDDPADPDDSAEVMPAFATDGLDGDLSIICLGNAWNSVTFSVSNNGNLQKGGVDVVAGVVNIQAQYGISASALSNKIVGWVDATGGTWATTATKPTLANRNLIKAVRIAVVTRNPKREQAEVTQGCSSLTAADPTGLCAWDGSAFKAPAIDLSADADWKHYRYRVFETIIPLRNKVWNAKTLD